MIKLKNLKKTFVIAMVLMLLTLISSTVYATSSPVIIAGNNVGGTSGGVQGIPTLNSINKNNAGSGVTTIPTTNTVKNDVTTSTAKKQTVTVTVTANKQVQAITGWTLSADKKVLTKQYTANTTETITLTDTAGNKSDAIQIKVDLSLTNGGTDVTLKKKGTEESNLTKTGIDYTALIIMAVCAISGMYAYLKIRDYNTIQY